MSTIDNTTINTGIVLGTADYLAPEQARGDPLSPASDLYSLGVVLYEMLAGRPPFVGTSAVQVAMQHTTSVPPPPSKYNPRIPRALELVVKKALQKEPERRYTSAEAMRKALIESLKKSMEEGATIPGHLPAVDQSPNRRVTAPAVNSERPEYAARPQPLAAPPERPQMANPPSTLADAEVGTGSARWTSLVILIVGIILLISLALGLYFAFLKPSSLAPTSPLAQTSQTLAQGHQQIQAIVAESEL